PVYYDRTYWLGPDGEAAERAYRLLEASMEASEKVGIGTVVMRNKQYLAAIRPLDGALALSTLRFADEVVPKSDVDAVPSRQGKSDAKELRLATQIIDSLTTDWEPERYHDTYTEELRDLIERRARGEQVEVDEAEPGPTKVVDLMEALQASIDAARKGRAAPSKGAARTTKAGSTTKAASTTKAGPTTKARKATAAKKSTTAEKATKAPARRSPPARSGKGSARNRESA
ncbi:MAG TPA: Ku protein, partial [Acidimicrobiales bacterium]